MIIYIPIQLKATGGTSTFARSFQQACRKLGHTVVFTEPNAYHLLLIAATAPLATVLRAKQRHIPIVHRLDGVHSATSVVSWKYPLYNLPMRLIRNRLANAIIYQSKFSEQVCNQYLGKLPTTHTPPAGGLPTNIIYNGVNTTIFSPRGSKTDLRDHSRQHLIFTAQRFRRLDQIEPLLQSLTLYRQRYHADTKFIIAGDFVEPLPTSLTNSFPPWVHLLGPVSPEEVARHARAADAFVYCHPHPACPNNVLEALACGLPVVGVTDGAMPEIIHHGHNGFLTAPSTRNFNTPRTFSHDQFAHNIHQAVQLPRIPPLPQTYTGEHMTKQYLNLFEQLTQRTP